MPKHILKRWIGIAGLLGLLALPAIPVNAQVPLENYNALRDVRVTQDEDGLRIQLQFKKPLTKIPHPTFFKRSVQMDFPLTYVDPPKRYFDTGSNVVSQVYASQFDSELMRVRLMLGEADGINASNFSVRTDGSVMNVDIRKSYADDLDVLLARATQKKSLTIEKTAPSGEIKPVQNLAGLIDRAQEKARGQSGNPSSIKNNSRQGAFTKSGSSSAPNKKKGEPITLKKEKSGPADGILGIKDGKDSESGLWGTAITMLATLAVVLGFMFLLFHLFKKFVWKNGVFGTEDKPIKVLSTGFLGPKKSIALVEVAGDILVLGISNDQISLLSNVQDQEKIEKIRSMENGSKLPVRKKKGKVAEPERTPDSVATALLEEEEEDEIYSSRRRPKQFKEYVKKYSEPAKDDNHSVNDVTRMIRSQLVKARVAQ